MARTIPLLHRRVPVAEFRFRYEPKRRRAQCYDVAFSLGCTGELCHIEIRHATHIDADAQAFTSGALSPARLRRAVELLALVDRVVSRDRTRVKPGSLIFSARLKTPPAARPLPPFIATGAGQRPSDAAKLASRPRWLGPAKRSARPWHEDQARAHGRYRYPSRGI
ncbi:hypothetical protein [Paraburkholderia rhizosphaerae]|uniref:Uncharacterized protein n=1 Tax=Paraburkholderia rhizosphaerae TaxID=480658 RepID=A0A4R8LTW4_9BURK|nr:hypothetical protein [Paraburkholderia rhizosphaerae]TDY50958.1 hypothetical protein BX592_108195 [Paraburkholderia rhizosphaerae]